MLDLSLSLLILKFLMKEAAVKQLEEVCGEVVKEGELSIDEVMDQASKPDS